MRRLAEEIRQGILEMYNDTSNYYSQKTIAEKLGICQASVSKVIQQQGGNKRVQKREPTAISQQKKLRLSETTNKQQRMQIDMLNRIISLQEVTIATQKEFIKSLKDTPQEVMCDGQDQLIKSQAEMIESLRDMVGRQEATIKAQELTITTLGDTIKAHEATIESLQSSKKKK